MYKIFKFHYENYLRGYISGMEKGKECTAIVNNMKKYIPKYGEYILIKKFPSEELKKIAKMECNTEWTNKVEDIEGTINSSKKLRLMLNIKEKNVCFGCSKKDKCKFFELLPEIKGEKKDIASITDLQVVLNGFYRSGININSGDSQGYEKLSISIPAVKNKNSENIQTIAKRFDNKVWKSANILIELVNETLNDLVNNNGVAFKTLINAFIESKGEEEKTEIVEGKVVEKAFKNLDDPYVKLLKELKECKNRKEKKRLLAKFNQSVGFGWGEYRKVYKEKVKPEEEKSKEGNKDKNSAPVPCNKLLGNDSSNNNTMIMTEGRIKRIQSVSETTKAVTQHFSQKIDMRKAKTKLLQGQQNLSLLLNKFQEGNMIPQSSEKSYVKIPGADYKRALEYAGEENRHHFDQIVHDRKDILSVDIRSNIEKKMNKVDRKLEKNKKFTLMKHLGTDEEKRQLQGQSDSHKLALDSFENKLSLGSSQNEITVGLDKVIDVKNPADEIDPIRFEKQNEIAGLEFYKQMNVTSQEKVKKGQELAKVKKVVKNKHVYKAHHFYNNTNLEHLPYEKDADISRSVQFEKSIFKKEVENK